MPTKRPDESQDAFVVRCIRDDEAEACIETAIDCEIPLKGNGYDSARTVGAIVQAIRTRISERAHG